MKKAVLEAIAKKLICYDLGSTSFYEGAFCSLVSLLEDFGYTFQRSNGRFIILDSQLQVACSVPFQTTWMR